MKMALFTYTTLEYGGGVAKYFTEIAIGLKRRYPEIDIDIVTFDEKTLKVILGLYNCYFLGKQDRVISKENESRIKKSLGKVGYIKSGLWNLKNNLSNYDVVYTTNNLLEVLLFSYLIGTKNLPPIIYGFHVPMVYTFVDSVQSRLHNYIYSSDLYIKALGYASKLHTLNGFDEKLLSKHFPGSKVTKIYNAFNFKKFAELSKQYIFKFNWAIEKINILWVGRLTEQKGIDILIEIITFINTTELSERVTWNIVGEGELKPKILKTEQKWSNVNYLGYVENNYLPSIFARNDLFISTSRWESLPRNVQEAKVFNMPVIAFNINGCNEIIKNNQNGYLVNDTLEFEEKIKQLAQKGIKKTRGIDKVLKTKFNEEKILNSLYKLLKDL